MSEMLEAFAMSGMIDRVSRAICEAEYGVGATVDNVHKLQAIAAVRALREPDEGMLKVGQREYLFGVNFCAGEPYASDEAAYQLWLSMIDSILSTPTTRGEVK